MPQRGEGPATASVRPGSNICGAQAIERAFDGEDPEAASEAREALREIFGGAIMLTRRDGELWAEMKLRPAALLKQGVGFGGSGGRI